MEKPKKKSCIHLSIQVWIAQASRGRAAERDKWLIENKLHCGQLDELHNLHDLRGL